MALVTDETPAPVLRGYSAATAYGSVSPYVDDGSGFDYALNGIPFVSAVSPDSPYVRESVPLQKDRFDNSSEPGEQSLAQWWTKAQSSFHAGAGARWTDLGERDSDRFRFGASRGVDVWTPGEIGLLHECERFHTAGTIIGTGSRYPDGEQCLVWADGKKVFYVDSGGSPYELTVTDFTNNIVSMAFSGSQFWITDGDQIATGYAGWGIYMNAYVGVGGPGVLAYVKQRCMFGRGADLFEIDAAVSAPLPTPKFSHPDSLWEWSAISEGPAAVYAAGYAGDRSAIYKFVLDTDGAVPTLSSGITTVELPYGEVIYDMTSYTGTHIVVCTNKGVRVGRFEGDDIVLGALSVEYSADRGTVEAYDRFAYAAFPFEDGSAGLCRIDLSQPIDDAGRYAWATDVVARHAGADVAGTIKSIVFHDGVPHVGLTAGGIYRTASTFVPSGWLDSARVRFSTLEQKLPRYVRVRGEWGEGTVSVAVSQDATVNSPVSVIDLAVAQDSGDTKLDVGRCLYSVVSLVLTAPAGRLVSPVVTGYQLKALPVAAKQRMIRVPLVCADSEVTRTGSVVRSEFSALERVQMIEALDSRGDAVLFQVLGEGGSSEVATIESVQFVQDRGPFDRDGTSGVLTVTLRTAL